MTNKQSMENMIFLFQHKLLNPEIGQIGQVGFRKTQRPIESARLKKEVNKMTNKQDKDT